MTELIFTSTADIENHFISSQNNKDEKNWSDGDALIAALRLKAENDELVYTSLKSLYFEVLAPIVQDSYSTVNNQWRTSVIFPEGKRAAEKCWSVHRQAARAVKRITRTDDYTLAHEWLDRALKDNLTTDALADVMAGAKTDVHKDKPVYLCKRAAADLTDIKFTLEGDLYFTFRIHVENASTFADVKPSSGYLITAFIPAIVDHVNSEAESEAA